MGANYPWRSAFLALICLAAIGEAKADVTLPAILAEHMVIQRDKPVHLWGNADPQEMIEVEFRGNHASTVAGVLGRWSVYLPPGSAAGPFDLTIRGKNVIAFHDILVGDVWVASGQSNMEFPMGLNHWWHLGVNNMGPEIAKASYPKLRLFHVEMQHADFPRTDAAARTWTATTPQSVADFSAVAHFFGREILEKEKIPIGLIESDVGGTPAEAWTSLDALTSDTSLMPVFAAWSGVADGVAANQRKMALRRRAYEKTLQQGQNPAPYDEPRSSFFSAPSQLYNAMIAPLTPFPIRGVIWYQGESNTDAARAPIYEHLFQAMITDWRRKWEEGDFPFLYVQLANFTADNGWATVREAQRRTLALVNTGMAVTIDVGDASDIHPRDKQDVGHRLALWARAISYDEDIEDSGPLFRQAVPEGDHMRIWFDHDFSGLMTKGPELKGFEVAGTDGVFVAASASIEGNTVLAFSPDVPVPVYVRYAWSANPSCTLYNRIGLPASPFTSQR